MEEITSAILQKAIDGIEARYLHTADNIANAGTEGFRPVRVSFEESLREAAAKGPDAVRALTLEKHRDAPDALSGEMRLDLEIAKASQTAMRYSALVEVLGRHMALSRIAVTGGQ